MGTCKTCGKKLKNCRCPKDTAVSESASLTGLDCPECEKKDKALADTSEALSIALKFVPLESKNKDQQALIDKIYFLIKRATN